MDPKAIAAVLLSPQGCAALAAGATGTLIYLLRKALDWTQEDLAERSGYSQATISRIERGITRATRDTVVLTDIAEALGVPPEILGIVSAPDERTILENVKRRKLLSGGTGLVVTALLPQNVATPGRIEATDVAQCWTALRRLEELDAHQGGTAVCQVAEGIAGRLQDAVRQGSYQPEVGLELRRVTAAAMDQVGWLAYDAGWQDKARRWWLETGHFAGTAEAPDVRVSALAAMALQANDAGNGQEAVELIQTARKTASQDQTHFPMLSLLAAREAVGHALTGDRSAATNALGQAHQWLERGRAGDEPFWLDFWGPADLASHERRVALVTRQSKAAEVAARAALASADAVSFPRNRILYAADLGSVLIQRGQLDEAISVTTEAIQAVHAVQGSARVVDELHRTVDLLGQQNYPAATNFAAAARRLLPATAT
ncbi:MAG: helix-turn-helix domain-containing protein [Pseudonocardiales bacterium]|nr:helix-turn-helix domain-containing protein [Pseudonocardiales bacterium]